MGHPYDVERASELHLDWIVALAERLDVATTHRSAPQLKAVMHELRRSVDSACVARIANALPSLERGIFMEGWLPDEGPVPLPSVAEFADRVYQRIHLHHARIDSLTADVFWLFTQKLEQRQADAIRDCLPDALRDLWPRGDGKATRS